MSPSGRADADHPVRRAQKSGRSSLTSSGCDSVALQQDVHTQRERGRWNSLVRGQRKAGLKERKAGRDPAVPSGRSGKRLRRAGLGEELQKGPFRICTRAPGSRPRAHDAVGKAVEGHSSSDPVAKRHAVLMFCSATGGVTGLRRNRDRHPIAVPLVKKDWNSHCCGRIKARVLTIETWFLTVEGTTLPIGSSPQQLVLRQQPNPSLL